MNESLKRLMESSIEDLKAAADIATALWGAGINCHGYHVAGSIREIIEFREGLFLARAAEIVNNDPAGSPSWEAEHAKIGEAIGLLSKHRKVGGYLNKS